MLLNFKVQGYDKKDVPDKKKPEVFVMHEVVEFYVFAETAAKAIQSARSIIKKKFYRISRVDEHLHSDPWAKFPFEKLKKLLSK